MISQQALDSWWQKQGQVNLKAALVSALVALPLALAFGVASGLGAESGVIAAVVAGGLSAWLGGARLQHSGPTGGVAVLLALTLVQLGWMLPDANAGELAALGLTVVMLAGAMQWLFGWLRWGRFVELLPQSVIAGLLTSVGLMLVIEQLPTLLGQASVDRPLAVLMALPGLLALVHWPDLMMGSVAGLLMWVLPRWLPGFNRRLPAPVLVLVGGTLLAWLLGDGLQRRDWDEGWQLGYWQVVGPLTLTMPQLHLPSMDSWTWPFLIQSAFTLALVSAVISLLGALVAEKLTREVHDPDRELMGQGIGNLASGLLGGMASTGAPMRTSVAVAYGASAPWAAVVHAVLVGVLAWLAMGWIAGVPLALLAGMLVKVGLDQVDWRFVRRWRSVPRAGRAMMLAVLVTALVLDLVSAVVVGLVLASLLLLGRMTQLQLQALQMGTRPDQLPEAGLNAREQALLLAAEDRVLLFHLDVPMSFGAARALARRLAGVRVPSLVLDVSAVPYVDFSSALVLEDLVYRAHQQGQAVWLVVSPGAVFDQLDRQGLLKLLADRATEDREQALCAAVRHVQLGRTPAELC